MPVLLLLALLVYAGRIALAHSAADEAAIDAARTASIARDPHSASQDADTAARQTLAAQGLHCATLTVTVDVSGFSVPVGQPATVTAHIACTVSLSDLAELPGVPGTRLVTATMTSPLDTFRAR